MQIAPDHRSRGAFIFIPADTGLAVGCKLKFRCFSNSPTTVWLIRWSCSASSAANRRRLLQGQ